MRERLERGACVCFITLSLTHTYTLCSYDLIAVTKSNEWSGKRTFNGRCLHNTDEPHVLNPYEDVIETIGKTLRDFGARMFIRLPRLLLLLRSLTH